MRSLRQLCAAFILAITLAFSAFAGQIETTVVSPPPQPTTQATTDGQIETTSAGQIETTFQAVLNLLQGVLSLI